MSLAFESCPSSWPENREIVAPRPARPLVNLDATPAPRSVASALDMLAVLTSSWITPFVLREKITDAVGFEVGSATVRRLLAELVNDGSAELRSVPVVGRSASVHTYRRSPNNAEMLNALVAAMTDKPRSVRSIRASEVINDRGDAMPASHAEMLRLLRTLAEQGRVVCRRAPGGNRQWQFSRQPALRGAA